METVSFNKDSPKTTIYNVSFTRISTNVDKTAIGSTAVINEAKSRHSSRVNSVPPYIDVLPNPQSVNPMHMVLKSLFNTAKRRIVPRLSKKARLGKK